jgi:hypothetical protein
LAIGSFPGVLQDKHPILSDLETKGLGGTWIIALAIFSEYLPIGTKLLEKGQSTLGHGIKLCHNMVKFGE